MRVFISWSGSQSKGFAQALKDWLPLVLHYVEPWMSEASIDAGERWGIAVAKELEASNFGIICITRENIVAPWVYFEAGALAKSLEDSRVIPLLLDLDFKDISGPLVQFQAKKAEKSGVLEVVQSINQAANHAVPEARAKDLFDALWPKLENQLAATPKPANAAKPSRATNEVIEELVSSVRSLEARIRDISDEPRSHRRGMKKVHPYMMHEVVAMLGDRPGDPIALMIAASYFRDDLPWLYELAIEAYRASREGNSRLAADATNRFRRAMRLLEGGLFPIEEFGFDPRIMQVMLREWGHLFDNAKESDPKTVPPTQSPNSLDRGKTIR